MKCPVCESDHIAKAGLYPTVSEGKKQRYKCMECGRTFYDPEREDAPK